MRKKLNGSERDEVTSHIGPADIGRDPIKRTSVDIRTADHLFMESLAAHRNALADTLGETLSLRWSKKQLAELFIQWQCEAARQNLADLFEALGPFPDPTNRAACLAYARKTLQWSGKAEAAAAKTSKQGT